MLRGLVRVVQIVYVDVVSDSRTTLEIPHMKILVTSSAIAIGLIASVLIPGPAYADPNPHSLNGTSKGDSILSTAQHRFDALAENESEKVRVDDYQVVTNVPGDAADAIWVLPPGAEVPVVRQLSDGSISVDLTTSSGPTTSGNSGGAGGRGGAFSFGTLSWNSPTCYARYSNVNGWLDRCVQWGRILNDGDSAREHVVFKFYGTCKSNPGFTLTACSLTSVKSAASGTLYWEDWAPKADSNGACRSTSISVSAFGVSVGDSYQACEVLNITKNAAAGSFSNQWAYSGGVAGSERSVEYQISLGVTQGSSAVLNTSFVVTGNLHI